MALQNSAVRVVPGMDVVSAAVRRLQAHLFQHKGVEGGAGLQQLSMMNRAHVRQLHQVLAAALMHVHIPCSLPHLQPYHALRAAFDQLSAEIDWSQFLTVSETQVLITTAANTVSLIRSESDT